MHLRNSCVSFLVPFAATPCIPRCHLLRIRWLGCWPNFLTSDAETTLRPLPPSTWCRTLWTLILSLINETIMKEFITMIRTSSRSARVTSLLTSGTFRNFSSSSRNTTTRTSSLQPAWRIAASSELSFSRKRQSILPLSHESSSSCATLRRSFSIVSNFHMSSWKVLSEQMNVYGHFRMIRFLRCRFLEDARYVSCPREDFRVPLSLEQERIRTMKTPQRFYQHLSLGSDLIYVDVHTGTILLSSSRNVSESHVHCHVLLCQECMPPILPLGS
jgi:hypothetical protein